MLAILLVLAWLSLCTWALARWPWFRATGIPVRWLWAAFALKLVAGGCLLAIYTWYYPVRANADVYKYFDDGNRLYAALHSEHPGDYFRMLFGLPDTDGRLQSSYFGRMDNWFRANESPIFNDSRTLIRFNALIRPLSGGYVAVHVLLASFAAFFGLAGIYRALLPLLPQRQVLWAATVFLLPSLLFWSSAPLKECIVILGMGPTLWGLLAIHRRSGERYALLALITGLLVLASVKPYVFGALLPGAIVLLLFREGNVRSAVIGWCIAHGLLLVAVWFAPYWLGFDVITTITVKQRDFLGLVSAEPAGSALSFPTVAPGFGGLLLSAPHALYVTFISPFIGFRFGALGILGAVENLLLPFLLFALWRNRQRLPITQWPLFLFLIGAATLMALLIGWTTPAVGAVVRYRTPLLPLFVAACLLWMRSAPLQNLLTGKPWNAN